MSTVSSGRRRAAPMRKIVLWLPIVAMPFSMVFFDTYINVKVRLNDYRMYKINQERANLEREANALAADQAWRSSMSRMGERAPDLGLAEPNPSQIQMVYYRPEGGAPAGPYEYDIARVAHATPDPAVPHEPVARR